jgi:putative transposase
MKRKRFAVEQITGILKQAELGTPIADICRQHEHGISEQSYYRWKKAYGGMEPSEARELKQLRDENTKLKRLVADLSLDKVMLQDVVQKSGEAGPEARSGALPNRPLRGHYAPGLPVRPDQAVGVLLREHPGPLTGTAPADAGAGPGSGALWLPSHSGSAPARGQGRGPEARVPTVSRRRAGPAAQATWRHVSTVHRLQRQPAARPNDIWSMGFVADQLADGRRFRTLTVVDLYTRECLAIEVGKNLRAENVVQVMNQLKYSRGLPQRIYCDNGSEFVSGQTALWAYSNQVQIDFSRRGKPTDNAVIESFNGRFREECLNAHWYRVTERRTREDRRLAMGLQ